MRRGGSTGGIPVGTSTHGHPRLLVTHTKLLLLKCPTLLLSLGNLEVGLDLLSFLFRARIPSSKTDRGAFDGRRLSLTRDSPGVS